MVDFNLQIHTNVSFLLHKRWTKYRLKPADWQADAHPSRPFGQTQGELPRFYHGTPSDAFVNKLETTNLRELPRNLYKFVFIRENSWRKGFIRTKAT
jgi:hypothetical protein